MSKKKTARQLLGESLEELLRVKSFEKITVNEIVENCGVARRTFYTNFKDKYDLAAWMYTRELSCLLENNEQISMEFFLRHSVDAVNNHLPLIIALNKYKGQNSLKESLEHPMTEAYVTIIEKYYGQNVNEEMKREIEFFVGGQIAYVSRVIDTPHVPSTEDATAFFIRCMPEALKQFI